METQPPVAWHRSRRCDSSACIEVALIDGRIAVRESERPDGPILRFTHAEWSAFAAGIRDGEFQFD
jgi:hypothetical protein